MRLALSWLTVLPVHVGTVDRRAAAGALRWAPVVGLLLGGAAGGLLVGLVALGAPSLVAGLLTVGALAAATRGMHVDGLADTADGLGSRAEPAGALEIMKRSDIGPFGVITLVLALGVDVAALAAFERPWQPVAALASAATAGRVAAMGAAHPRIPSARPGGFGSLVAGSTPANRTAIWVVVTLAATVGLARATHAEAYGWVAATLIALMLTQTFLFHVRRRLGGVTGDVFGAVVELGTALTLAALAIAA